MTRQEQFIAEHLATRCYSCKHWDRPGADTGPVPSNRYYRTCHKVALPFSGAIVIRGTRGGELANRSAMTPNDFGCSEFDATERG